MILGIDELLRLVRESNLLTELSDHVLTRPEGAGFDLRAGEIYRIDTGGFLGIEERKTSEVTLLAEYDETNVTTALLEPDAFYLVRTIEQVKTPANLVALFVPRSTLFRSGVGLFTAANSPGYEGPFTFGLKNLSAYPFELELGARVAHILFFEVKGSTERYRGQWQGGRVSTSKKEKQV